MMCVNEAPEEWRWIEGYEGEYEVSDKGRIKSYKRRPPHILKSPPNTSGYPRVGLHKTGIGSKMMPVHRLVLETFVGPCPEGMQALHRNGNTFDSRLENLRWGSPQENILDKLHGHKPHDDLRIFVYKERDCIADLIKILAFQRGWNAGQLGERSGISSSAMYRKFNKKTTYTTDEIQRVLSSLEVDIKEFVSSVESGVYHLRIK